MRRRVLNLIVAVDAIADKTRTKQSISNIIDQFGTPLIEQFVGASRGDTLEHEIRRHFVDPFLGALGWDQSQLDQDDARRCAHAWRNSTSTRLFWSQYAILRFCSSCRSQGLDGDFLGEVFRQSDIVNPGILDMKPAHAAIATTKATL